MAERQGSQPEEPAAERKRLLKSLEEARQAGERDKIDQIAHELEALREENPTVEEETKRLAPDLGEELIPTRTLTATRPLNPEDRLDAMARQKGQFAAAFDLVSLRRLTPKDLRIAGSEHGGIVRALPKASGPTLELKDVMDAQRELEEEDEFKPFAGKLAPVARIRAEYKKLAHAFKIRMLDPKNLLEWLEGQDRLQSVVSGHRSDARTELGGSITDGALLGLAVDEKKKVLLLASIIMAASFTGEPLRGFVKGLPGIEYTGENIVKPSKHDRDKPE
jgi:hypothetical protein